MKKIDPSRLSLAQLNKDYRFYKKLVESYQASFGEYEIFVRIQRELVLRRAERGSVFPDIFQGIFGQIA